MNYDCIVVGAGAAGMMAAITASATGAKVAIIEHTDKMGKKILQTGNGRCNLTNLFMHKDCYKNNNSELVMQALEQFSVEDTLEFFKKIGIYPKSRNGYIYPNSDQAASVAEVLKMELHYNNVNVLLETKISSIKKQKDFKDKGYELKTDKGTYTCNSLIIATGSKASPKTGADGSGYDYAKNLGHTIIEPLPALVQLKSGMKICKMMAGVRSEGTVTLFINGKEIASDTGEVQYTDYGISGIPIFQISRDAVRAVHKGQKTEVVIDMLPNLSTEEFKSMIMNRSKSQGYKTIQDFFTGLLNKKLIDAVLKENGIDTNTTIEKLSKEKIEIIISAFKSFKVSINGFHSFESGQICSGGIDLSEIDIDTMESKINKGIYFAGEILDVDGICGGYNLQWAWTSGHIAGKHAVMIV